MDGSDCTFGDHSSLGWFPVDRPNKNVSGLLVQAFTLPVTRPTVTESSERIRRWRWNRDRRRVVVWVRRFSCLRLSA